MTPEEVEQLVLTFEASVLNPIYAAEGIDPAWKTQLLEGIYALHEDLRGFYQAVVKGET